MISKLCTIKYAFKSCTLAELWTGMLLPRLVSISPLKSSFCEKKRNKKRENNYTNKHSFNLSKSWKQKYFDSITYKNPKTLWWKEYWYSCQNATRECYYAKSNIDIVKMTFDMLTAVSETI